MECVCEITADLSNLRGGLVEKVSPNGNYWILDYNVVIEFGGTELHAYLEWTEKVSLFSRRLTLILISCSGRNEARKSVAYTRFIYVAQ